MAPLHKGFLKQLIKATVALTLILFLHLFLPFSVHGSDAIRVGIFQNKPLSFLDDKGVAQGIYPDLVREIARRENWDIEFVLDSWSGCLARLKSGDIDLMTSIVFSKERDKVFDFSKETVVNAWGQVYIGEDSDIPSILDLEGKTIAVMAKDINGRHFIDLCNKFRVKCNFIKVNTYDEVCELVLAGKADAGVINNVNGPFLLRKYNIRSTSIMFNPVSASFAVSKGKNQALVTAIDSYLLRWRSDKGSVYYEILNKWYGNIENGDGIPHGVFATIIIIAAGFALLFFVWNSQLKRTVKTRTEALRLSERRYREIVEGTDDLVTRVDDKGNFTYVNYIVEKIYGYPAKDCIGLSAFDFLHPDDKDRTQRAFSGWLKNRKTSASIENRQVSRTGDVHHMLWTTNFRYDEGGKLVEATGIAHDISQHKQAEQALRESEDRLKSFYEATFEGLAITGDGKILDANPRFSEIFGYRRDELIGADVVSILSEVVSEEDRELVLRNIRSGFEKPYEHRAVRKDGTVLYIEVHGQQIQFNGRPARIAAIHDITERRRAEEALLESEKRFRDLVESVPVGICIFKDGRAVYINPEQEKILGNFPMHSNFTDLSIHPEDTEQFIKNCHSVFAPGAPGLSFDMRIYPTGAESGNEKMKWVHCSTGLMEFEGGRSVLVSMVDIDRTKELEMLLRIKDKMISLGHVAAGIAHEIRNPLSGINVLLDGIRENIGDPESGEIVDELVDEALRASGKIENVIKRVLDFSRPAETNLHLCDINDTIKEAIKLYNTTLRKSGISIEIELGENLPSLFIDNQLIEQVLLNLVNNSFSAMKNINREKIIRILSSLENDAVIIRVSDSGNGVPETMREKIFDPFFTTRKDGSGIGLSLCQRIIADHGGTIQAFSSDLGGAEFRIKIPVEKRQHIR